MRPFEDITVADMIEAEGILARKDKVVIEGFRRIAVQWETSEWAEGGFSAYEGGVDANVMPSDSEDAAEGEWTWDVKATAEVSEWPELFDMGFEPTMEKAKAAAEKSLARAVESYKGAHGVDKFYSSKTAADDWSGGWARPNEMWGTWIKPDGTPVRMYRGKGNKVRFYDAGGNQHGEEQSNVGPGMGYAESQGWHDPTSVRNDFGPIGGVDPNIASRKRAVDDWSTSYSNEGPTKTWPCGQCGATVERYRGESDVTCGKCGAQYNSFGQRLRDDWRGNQSNYDEDIGDMEGYEQQQLRGESAKKTAGDDEDDRPSMKYDETGQTYDDDNPDSSNYDEERYGPKDDKKVSCRKCTAGATPDGEDCGYCDGMGSLDATTAMIKAADGWEQGITAEAFTRTAVDTGAQGTDRYQKTKHPSQVPWADADDWDHGQASQEELDQGRANGVGHVSSEHTADVKALRARLNSLNGMPVKVTYTADWGVSIACGTLSMADGNAAITSISGTVVSVPAYNVLSAEATGYSEQDSGAGQSDKEPGVMDMIMRYQPSGMFADAHQHTANPYSDQNPYSTDGPGSPDSVVKTQPQTTRPRVMPKGPAQQDSIFDPEKTTSQPGSTPRLGPVDRDANSVVIPTHARLQEAHERFTQPPELTPRQAKVAAIAAGVAASNPGMNPVACQKVAEATLQRFAGVVRS